MPGELLLHAVIFIHGLWPSSLGSSSLTLLENHIRSWRRKDAVKGRERVPHFAFDANSTDADYLAKIWYGTRGFRDFLCISGDAHAQCSLALPLLSLPALCRPTIYIIGAQKGGKKHKSRTPYFKYYPKLALTQRSGSRHNFAGQLLVQTLALL